MGQAPCACSSKCEPLVHYADATSDTVKVDTNFINLLDEIYEPAPLDKAGRQPAIPASGRIDAREVILSSGSSVMQSVPRCQARLTREDQDERRSAMAEAAAAAARASAEEDESWRIFEEKMQRELQAQLEDEKRRRERRKALQEEEERRKKARAEEEAAEAAKVAEAALAAQAEAEAEVEAEAAQASACQEEEEGVAVPVATTPTPHLTTAHVADTLATPDNHEEALSMPKVCSEEELTKFLTLEGFKSATSSRRRMLQTTYPLHVAVNRNDAGLVRSLLAARADATKRSGGQTAQQLAEKKDRQGSHAEVLSAFRSV